MKKHITLLLGFLLLAGCLQKQDEAKPSKPTVPASEAEAYPVTSAVLPFPSGLPLNADKRRALTSKFAINASGLCTAACEGMARRLDNNLNSLDRHYYRPGTEDFNNLASYIQPLSTEYCEQNKMLCSTYTEKVFSLIRAAVDEEPLKQNMQAEEKEYIYKAQTLADGYRNIFDAVKAVGSLKPALISKFAATSVETGVTSEDLIPAMSLDLDKIIIPAQKKAADIIKTVAAAKFTADEARAKAEAEGKLSILFAVTQQQLSHIASKYSLEITTRSILNSLYGSYEKAEVDKAAPAMRQAIAKVLAADLPVDKTDEAINKISEDAEAKLAPYKLKQVHVVKPAPKVDLSMPAAAPAPKEGDKTDTKEAPKAPVADKKDDNLTPAAAAKTNKAASAGETKQALSRLGLSH